MALGVRGRSRPSARRDLIRFAGNRAQIMTWLIQPLLFLFVLGSGLQSLSAASTGGVDLKTFIFPGVLCIAVLFTAMFSAASLVWDRELGFLREMMVAPVSRTSIVVGKCLGGATIAASQGVIVLALAGLVGVPYDPLLILGAFGLLVLLAFTVTAFGVLVAVTIKQAQTFTWRDAAVRDPDVLPVRRALPRLRAAGLARRAQPDRPADLRGRPDAPAGVRPPRRLRDRAADAGPGRHLVGLAPAGAARGGHGAACSAWRCWAPRSGSSRARSDGWRGARGT